MPVPLSSPVFVGREEELALLTNAVDRAATAEGSAVLVAGESGIGKSRLIAELCAHAEAEGAVVLVGECLELAEGELAYGAILGAFRPLVRGRDAAALKELAGSDGATLAGLLPEFAMADEGSAERADREQAAVFEALLRVLSRLGQEALVLLVIEDLHWADPSTRDFLSFLVRNSRGERLAIVATYRSDELHRRHPVRPFVLELERGGRADRVDLHPFDADELRRQLTAIEEREPERREVERLLERSDGNPFFVEELLALSSAGAPLPASVRDALLMRVEALGPETRQVLRIAAVAGREVDHDLLEAAGGLADEPLNECLREAIAAYVLVGEEGGRGYRFRHALLREAVYDDLLPGERRDLHLALARTLADAPGGGPGGSTRAAELAFHWYAAHELGPALDASVEAGVEAEGLRAFGEAAIHLERALGIWDAGLETGAEPALDRGEAMRRAAEAQALSGNPDRAVALTRSRLEAIDEQVEPIVAARARERLARHLWAAGRSEEALAAQARAVELIPAEPRSEDRALVLAGYAQLLMLENRYDECVPYCEEALEVARELGAELLQARVLNTISPTYSVRGEPLRGAEACAEARRIATRLGDVLEVGRSYINGGDALDQAGLVEESIALAREGIAAIGGDGKGQIADHLGAEIAARLLRLGRWEEAQALQDEIGERSSSGVVASQVESLRALLHAWRGEVEAARPHAERARELTASVAGEMWTAPLQLMEAALALSEGRPEDAWTAVARGLDGAHGLENPFYTGALYEAGARAAREIALRGRRSDSASEQEARIEGLLDRLGGLLDAIPGTPPPEAVGSRMVCEAELGRVRGDVDPAPWTRAREFWDELGDSHRAAWARLAEAGAILASGGERDAATALLREAAEVAGDLGAAPLGKEVDALARRSRLRVGVASAAAPTADGLAALDLTPRELEVIGLMAEGQTNREIAATLFISTKTAGTHVSHILLKCDARNRAEAVAVAQRLGL